jgi:hypothetical protein
MIVFNNLKMCVFGNQAFAPALVEHHLDALARAGVGHIGHGTEAKRCAVHALADRKLAGPGSARP